MQIATTNVLSSESACRISQLGTTFNVQQNLDLLWPNFERLAIGSIDAKFSDRELQSDTHNPFGEVIFSTAFRGVPIQHKQRRKGPDGGNGRDQGDR